MTSPSLLLRLPPHLAADLATIAATSKTALGDPRPVQWVVDRHLPRFEALIAAGVDHAHLSALLAEVGITDHLGRPLPIGTLSSAIHRARLKAAAVAGRSMPEAAEPCMVLQRPAHSCTPLQGASISDRRRYHSTTVDLVVPRPAGRGGETDPSDRSPPTPAASSLPPDAGPAPTIAPIVRFDISNATRRAADLLNRLDAEPPTKG